MANVSRFPRRGEVFTGAEVMQLPLRDSPSLCVPVKWDADVEHDEAPIQDAHLTQDELLSVPGFSESRWRFLFETDEWIPVFDFVGTADEALAFVDVSKEWDDTYQQHRWWVTPKGFPREYQ